MKRRSDERIKGMEFEFKGNYATYNDKCECDFWHEWCEKVDRAAEDMRNEDLGWK